MNEILQALLNLLILEPFTTLPTTFEVIIFLLIWLRAVKGSDDIHTTSYKLLQ
jgi:uncharacterized membrane protein